MKLHTGITMDNEFRQSIVEYLIVPFVSCVTSPVSSLGSRKQWHSESSCYFVIYFIMFLFHLFVVCGRT
ncbi:hypothetical protein F4803DRAFT_516446 [Xylaria telfairii]|nr:hypothetical protein F4803DRAFT_516446 [Xylaria telfairii]